MTADEEMRRSKPVRESADVIDAAAHATPRSCSICGYRATVEFRGRWMCVRCAQAMYAAEEVQR